MLELLTATGDDESAGDNVSGGGRGVQGADGGHHAHGSYIGEPLEVHECVLGYLGYDAEGEQSEGAGVGDGDARGVLDQ